MMWNWLGKLMGKPQPSRRKRVQVDIPFEQILATPLATAQFKRKNLTRAASKDS
ncbi:hypothetical protein [Shewanella sp. YIC-542]|uniref:hypothetical protein n=1 Tax=Shewanella mytili TaxID=3377111 RepID=UPI00398EB957